MTSSWELWGASRSIMDYSGSPHPGGNCVIVFLCEMLESMHLTSQINSRVLQADFCRTPFLFLQGPHVSILVFHPVSAKKPLPFSKNDNVEADRKHLSQSNGIAVICPPGMLG